MALRERKHSGTSRVARNAKYPTNSLERALLLLEAIERSPAGLTNADCSRRFHIPKSSCSYILSRLEQNGYVVRGEGSGRYKMGLTALALAYGALRNMEFRTKAEVALYKLASETGLSVNIGVLERGRVLLVDRVESPQFAKGRIDTENPISFRKLRKVTYRNRRRDQRDIGRELFPHSTALGKILLAHLPKYELLAVIAENGLPRVTANTITSQKKLMAELAKIRRQGYAVNYEEETAGICAIAAPITDASGKVLAAVSVNGYSTEVDWRGSTELVEFVTATALMMSRSGCFEQ